MVSRTSLFGPLDPAPDAGYLDAPPRMGFFTDTSVCIGCKACEVACNEWNLIPAEGVAGTAGAGGTGSTSGIGGIGGTGGIGSTAGRDLTGMSYDNTGRLAANSWRHVAFIEQRVADPSRRDTPYVGTQPADRPEPQFLGMPSAQLPGRRPAGTPGGEPGAAAGHDEVRWLMASDVCKHCTHAACLDVCPTGALFRTEFGTVVVQEDICNGCGYCIPACPYGVIDQRKGDGRAWKCTLCYDRIGVGMEPACAKACPTDSIQYGRVDQLRERAQARVEALRGAGVTRARLYGNDPHDGVGGTGAFFLLLDEPEVYGLPPDPVVTTRDLPAMWKRAGIAAVTMAAAAVAAFVGGGA